MHEFQPEAIPRSIAHDAGHPYFARGLEFYLDRITRLQQKAHVQCHTAAAYVGSAPRHHHYFGSVMEHDLHWQIDWVPPPPAQRCGRVRHGSCICLAVGPPGAVQLQLIGEALPRAEQFLMRHILANCGDRQSY